MPSYPPWKSCRRSNAAERCPVNAVNARQIAEANAKRPNFRIRLTLSLLLFGRFLAICCLDEQVAADSAMEQIATALSEASLRKGETEKLKEDLAVNEKATQGRKGDIEQVRECDARDGAGSNFLSLSHYGVSGEKVSDGPLSIASELAIISHGHKSATPPNQRPPVSSFPATSTVVSD